MCVTKYPKQKLGSISASTLLFCCLIVVLVINDQTSHNKISIVKASNITNEQYVRTYCGVTFDEVLEKVCRPEYYDSSKKGK